MLIQCQVLFYVLHETRQLWANLHVSDMFGDFKVGWFFVELRIVTFVNTVPGAYSYKTVLSLSNQLFDSCVHIIYTLYSIELYNYMHREKMLWINKYASCRFLNRHGYY